MKEGTEGGRGKEGDRKEKWEEKEKVDGSRLVNRGWKGKRRKGEGEWRRKAACCKK